MDEGSEFSRPVLDPTLRVAAADNESSRILYASDDKGNGIFKNYFSRLDRRRAAAREAIAIVLQHADEEAGVRSR